MKKYLNYAAMAMLLVFTVSVVSCNDDDDGNDGGNSPEKLIVGKWKPVKVFGDPLSFIFACMSDDVLEFKSDKTVTYDENGTFYGYNVTESQYPSKGTWSIKYDSELWKAWVLNLKGEGVFFFAENFEIVKVDDNTLIINNGMEYEFEKMK